MYRAGGRDASVFRTLIAVGACYHFRDEVWPKGEGADAMGGLPREDQPTRDDDPERTVVASMPGSEFAMPSASGTVARMRAESSRFVPLRPHARGALGEVFIARDEELGRQVALKAIQDRHADDPRSRARFVREARITGNLEHPGVVPVYGLGCSSDGRPYYAMRFIEGESLSEAIERFHRDVDPRRDPGAAAVALHALIVRFIDVCNAIDYAHGKGILHRDLKPSNIMLGPHGETLVVDWGLAKRMPGAEATAGGESAWLEAEPIGEVEERASGPEPRVSERVGGSALETMPGATLGTPAFMSPEQASGRPERLGPASDVYNLGATLYSLLTGRPAFQDTNVAIVLTKVQRGEFPRPRAAAPGRVPRALEAICLRAMALRVEDRYPSAAALRADLERWIADEPVSARGETPLDRMSRWGRRRRAWVVAGTSLLCALVTGLSIATAVVNRAREGERSSRLRAEGLFEHSEELAASLEIDQALDFFERGATSRGMLHLARAAEIAPAGAVDLRSALRANLAAWAARIYPLRQMASHGETVRAVAWNPLGKTALSAGERIVAGRSRGEAWLWDVETGRPVGRALEHELPIVSAAINRDGGLIATGSIDKTARLWSSATGAPVGPPLRHDGPVRAVGFARGKGGAEVLLTASGAVVNVWSTSDGKPAGRLATPHVAIEALAVSGDGRVFATAGEDGAARVWDAESHVPLGLPAFNGANLRAVALNRDGTLLALGGDNQETRLWKVDACCFTPVRIRYHATIDALAFSPDGDFLLTSGDDNTARIWRVDSGDAVGLPLDHRGSVMSAAFSPDGASILTGCTDGAARVFSRPQAPAPPRRAPEAANSPRGAFQLTAGAVSGDGLLIAAANSRGTIRVVSLADGLPLGPDLDVDPGDPAPASTPKEIVALALAPDGARLLVGFESGSARLVDLSTRRPIGPPLRHDGAVRAVAFSGDGTRIATGGDDGVLRVWNGLDARPETGPLQARGAVAVAAFRDGSKYLYSASGRVVERWDLGDDKPLGTVFEHQGPIYAMAISPDGKWIATGGENNNARLWNADDGTPVRPPMQHLESVLALAFSRDGRLLLTGGADHAARLWDVATSKPVGPPIEHHAAVTCVAFLGPHGYTYLTAGTEAWSQRHRVVSPWPDDLDPAGIRARVESLTGMRIDARFADAAHVSRLSPDDWRALPRFVPETDVVPTHTH